MLTSTGRGLPKRSRMTTNSASVEVSEEGVLRAAQTTKAGRSVLIQYNWDKAGRRARKRSSAEASRSINNSSDEDSDD